MIYSKEFTQDLLTPVAVYAKIKSLYKDEISFLFESAGQSDGNYSFIVIGARERLQYKNSKAIYTDSNGSKNTIDESPFEFLKTYYNNGGDLLKLFDNLGLTEYGNSAFLKRDGDVSYSNSRYYFASRHEGHLPSDYTYLAHENIGSYIISLGSWYGSNKIMVIKK